MGLLCYCNSKKNYLQCCDIYLNKNKLPKNPEQLMRSRYTAYATSNLNYIMNTMKANLLNSFNSEEIALKLKNIKWLKLEILNSNYDDMKGTIEFNAYYSDNGKKARLHEISKFERINDKWFYTSGQII